LEKAVVGGGLSRSESSLGKRKIPLDGSHYAIAQQMKHYHSVDFGNQCEWWKQGFRDQFTELLAQFSVSGRIGCMKFSPIKSKRT